MSNADDLHALERRLEQLLNERDRIVAEVELLRVKVQVLQGERAALLQAQPTQRR